MNITFILSVLLACLAVSSIAKAEEMEITAPIVIQTSWESYVDTPVTITPTADDFSMIAPAAGGADAGSKVVMATPSKILPLSLTQETTVADNKQKVKLQLNIGKKKNVSLRTKRDGLFMYKKIKIDPDMNDNIMPDSATLIEKPQFAD